MTAPLPIVVSVPHGGTRIPDEARPSCLLDEIDCALDGDTWARELFAIEDRVLAYVDTPVPRAVVDMNRDPDDRPPANPDGIVKTVTVQGKRIWTDPSGPPDPLASVLIERYHGPYHRTLHRMCSTTEAVLGLDCHTMLALGPAMGPGAGEPRPLVCLGNRGGPDGQEAGEPLTAPADLVQRLRQVLEEALQDVEVECRRPGPAVTINDPFRGGHITRHHARRGPLPWIQLEISRALYLPAGGAVVAKPEPTDMRRMAGVRSRIVSALIAAST